METEGVLMGTSGGLTWRWLRYLDDGSLLWIVLGYSELVGDTDSVFKS